MKRFCTLAYTLALLTFATLTFLPNTFAQGAAPGNMVRLVYFLPSDRAVRPERVEAFRQLTKEAQAFYADQMESHGYGRKTFNVETDAAGEPVVHRVDGKFNEAYYYKPLTDLKIWKEVYEHFDELEHIYLIAIDLSYETLDDGKSCGLGGIGFLPMGGDANFSVGKIAIRHRSETFGEEALGGSAILPASGPCFRDNSGVLHPLRVTTHELGHAFGLEHDFRERHWDNDTVLGGRGFHLSSCAAEWLSVSRFFNNPISDNTPGEIKLLSTPTYSPAGIRFRFEVTDADGLHQAQLIVPENRENGSWGPYRLFDCKRVNGKTRTLEFISPELVMDPVDRVTLQIIDVNGNITWATFRVDIASIVPAPKVVSIPDPYLAAAVRTQLELGPRASITDRAMQRLTWLNVEDRRITNIKGLEHATQLTSLYLANQISNYNQLQQLPKLRKLYLWGNGISDLSVLPPLPQLEFLDLNWNQISDVSPLSGFTNLKELWLQGNKLANTSTLFQLRNGTFPPGEEVEVIEEQDSGDRKYMLLVFKSLDLKVRINPDVVIFRSADSVVLVEVSARPPMYWINMRNGTLHRLVGAEVENLVPNVQNATSLAVDMATGKLYWTEKTSNRSGKIRRANLDGSNVQLIKNLTSVPLDLALDTTSGKLYLINAWGKVQRLNLNGKNFQPNLITGLEAPKHLTLDVVGGRIYWTERTSETRGKIQRANLDGSNVQLVKSFTSAPRGLALDAANRNLYLTNASGKVQRLNVDGSNFQPNLITGLDAPEEVSIDMVGRKLYWTEQGSLRRADLTGENIEDVVTGLGAPTGIVLGNMPVAVPAAPALVDRPPDATVLLANYPNPFNPETWIPYELAKSAEVTLHIYTANGTLVRTLALGHQPAGVYRSRSRAGYWDGRNEQDERVASGVYFYTLKVSGEFTATRKMLIQK